MSSIYSAASADSVLDSKEPGCEPSNSARSTLIAAASSPSTGPTCPATTTSKPLHLGEQISLGLMSSAADSPAKTSVRLGSVSGWPERVAAYGSPCGQLLASYNRDSSSWRTSQTCLIEGWERLSETWPRSGMTLNGTVYKLPTLAPLTDETESGLLATLTGKGNLLAPSMQKHPGCRRLLQTLIARDGRSFKGNVPPPKHQGGVSLTQALGGPLNPLWCEWYMGYPEGHTELKPSEIPSSRRSRKKSAKPS